MSNNYGWCQFCGALVFGSSQCPRCDGKVKEFCVDMQLVKLRDENNQKAERIKKLEKAIQDVCDAIHNEGKINKWKLARLEQALKVKGGK